MSRWIWLSGLLLLLPLICSAQPQVLDITPIPHSSVLSISLNDTINSGLWCTCCAYPNQPCTNEDYHPYYSSDGGTTWELRENGISEWDRVQDIHINPCNPNRLFAETVTEENHGRLWMSIDRGLHWTAVMDSLPPNDDPWYDYANANWFSDGAHAWALLEYRTMRSAYFTSSDSGATWTFMGDTFGDQPRPVWATHSAIPNIAVYPGGIVAHHRTVDFGHTEETYIDTNFTSLSEIVFGNAPNRLYSTAVSWGIPPQSVSFVLASNDTGRTFQFLNPNDSTIWTETGSGLYVIQADRSRPGHLFATEGDVLWETVNDGLSWQILLNRNHQNFWNEMRYDATDEMLYVADGNYVWDGIGIFRIGVSESASPRPATQANIDFRISPNPAPAGASLTLSLPGRSDGPVVLYDLLGREVMRSGNLSMSSTPQSTAFTLPPQLSSGIYILRLQSNQHMLSRKLLILR